jgi:hypothetical protein
MPGVNQKKDKSHIPRNSLFFEKIVPALLLLMGVVTLGLILFAVAVLIGIVKF